MMLQEENAPTHPYIGKIPLFFPFTYPLMWYWKHTNIYILSLVNFPTLVRTATDAPPRLGKGLTE